MTEYRQENLGVNQIDVIHALLLVQIALMHRIYAQIAWFSARTRLLAYADIDPGRVRLCVRERTVFVHLRAAEIVDMRDRYLRETFELRVSVQVEHVEEGLLQCSSGATPFRIVDLREECDVFCCVDACELRLCALLLHDTADVPFACNETIDLRLGVAGHRDEVFLHDTFVFLSQTAVAELPECPTDPLVCFIHVFTGKGRTV